MCKNDDFLRDYYRESQENMRFRSGVEYRLLQFLLLFFPIIGLAIVTLYNSSIEEGAFLKISVGAALFILLVTICITIKICAEHKNYRNMGQSIKKVWRYFKLQEDGIYLPDNRIIPEELVDLEPNKGYGSGKGHIFTLVIIWMMALAMIALTVILGIFPSTPAVSENVSTSAAIMIFISLRPL